MIKFLEWLGFLICLVSSLSNGIIRHFGLSNTIWLNVTFFLMFVGGMITIIAFLIGKLENKRNGKTL